MCSLSLCFFKERTRAALLEGLYQELHQRNLLFFAPSHFPSGKQPENSGLFQTFRKAISSKVRSPTTVPEEPTTPRMALNGGFFSQSLGGAAQRPDPTRRPPRDLQHHHHRHFHHHRPGLRLCAAVTMTIVLTHHCWHGVVYYLLEKLIINCFFLCIVVVVLLYFSQTKMQMLYSGNHVHSRLNDVECW